MLSDFLFNFVNFTDTFPYRQVDFEAIQFYLNVIDFIVLI